MAGIQDRIEFRDDFLGAGLLSATPSHDSWLIADTSASGTPTFTRGGVNGLATLTHESTAEAQNVCLYMADNLNFDIDLIDHIEIGLAVGQAALDTATQVSWGLASARNDDIDTIAEAALFRCIAGNVIVVETDDGTTNKDDVATGTSAGVAQQKYVISFANGKSDVRFYVGGERVAAATTFSMASYAGAFQPFFQIQKLADTNVDSVLIDYVKVESRRA